MSRTSRIFESAVTKIAEPRRQGYTGRVATVVNDAQGRVVAATVSIANPSGGYSAPVKINVPSGTDVTPGQSITLINIGTPSYAVWQMGSGVRVASSTAGGIIGPGGGITNEFTNIWLGSGSEINIGGTYVDGGVFGERVNINDERLLGYDAGSNPTIQLWWGTTPDHDAGEVFFGDPTGGGGYMQYKDSVLTVEGIIIADAFVIDGDAAINPASELIVQGRIRAGTDENTAILDGSDPRWRIYAGGSDPDTAPFRVDQSGYLYATYATIGGWDVGWDTVEAAANDDVLTDDYSSMVSGNGEYLVSRDLGVILDGSRNAISLGDPDFGDGGIQLQYNDGFPRFYAGDGSTYYFRWDGMDLSWAGNKTSLTTAGVFTAQDAILTGTIYASAGYISGLLTVGSSAPYIKIDGSNKLIESSNFASGTSGFRINQYGNAEFNDVDVRGVIRASSIQYDQILASNGSIVVAPSAGKFIADVTSVDSPSTFDVDVEDPDGLSHAAAGGLWAVSDIVRIKEAFVGDLWALVSSKTDMTTYWRIVCTKQSPAAGTNYTFKAGGTLINYGQSGDGWLRLTADATYAPYMSIATHAGSPWTTQTERVRVGNLDGISGASGYGLWSDNVFLTGVIQISNPEDINTSELTNDAGFITTAEAGGNFTYYLPSSTPPASPNSGDLWYVTDTYLWKRYNGSTWDTVGTYYIGSDGLVINTPAPSGAGLYISASYMGYYNSSAWKTYINNEGDFYLAGSSGDHGISWDASINTLAITGNITIKNPSAINTSELTNDAGFITSSEAGGIVTWYSASSSPPGSPGEGDLWYQTDTHLWKRWNGSSWDTVTTPMALA